MVLKQINLTLPVTLQKAAEEYTKRFGFKNMQELTAEALREKVFFQTEYDEELTEKEIEIIDKFINLVLKDKKFLVSERELDEVLLS